MIRRILINVFLSQALSRQTFKALTFYSASKKLPQMNKATKNVPKGKKAPPEEEKVSTPPSIYYKDGKTHIVIDAKPNSKSNAIVGINEEGVRVNIAAPPKEGEANKELLEYLAEVIGVKKTEISLDKGSKSKSKVVVVEGVDAVSVYDSLKEQIED